MSHIAILGQHPQLSLLELELVCQRIGIEKPSKSHPFIASLKIKDQSMAGQLQNTLGGTVKIAKRITQAHDQTEIIGPASDYLDNFEGKVAYGVSTFEKSIDSNHLAKNIKQELKAKGRQSRFRDLDSPQVSSGILTDYQELIVAKVDGHLHLYSTVTVQDIHRWKQKDFDRPAANPKSGMMPPKICRILTNISLPNQINASTKVFDPFCGSGTVLMEALDLGLSAIGSDISQHAISISHQNLDWFASNFNPPGNYRLLQADVHHLNQVDGLDNIDAIVFEGYLGPSHVKARHIPNQIKGLKKLYTGAFKQLFPLLKPCSRLVCALPEYHHQGSVKNLDSLIDTCEKFGYTQLGDPLTYKRPSAKVARRIYILQKSAS